MNNNKLLVTGASGFLGSHLMYSCHPAEVIGTYHTNMPENDGYTYRQIDLSDERLTENLLTTIKPKTLLHAAAKSNLDWCEQNPELARQANAEVPVKLAKMCREIDCKYLFVSSDMVFDGETGNYSEGDEVNPISVYAETKVAAEEGVLSANPRAIVARIALIYGLSVAPMRGNSFLSWVLDGLENNLPVPLYFDQYRTPVEARELADTLLELVKSDYCGTIHVAGSERVDRYTFGKYVCRSTGYSEKLLLKTSLAEDKNIARRPKDLSLQTDRLAAILGKRLSSCKAGLSAIFRKSR